MILLVHTSYHCHLYPHPETDEERADVMDSLRTRIQDLQNVRLLLSRLIDYCTLLLVCPLQNNADVLAFARGLA